MSRFGSLFAPLRRFLVVGLFNTAFGLATFPALYWLFQPMGVSYLWLMTAAQVINVTFSFVTNKLLVFRTKGGVRAEYAKFASYHLLVYLGSLVILPTLVERVGLTPVVAQTSYALVVIATSYLWHSQITFRSRRPLSTKPE